MLVATEWRHKLIVISWSDWGLTCTVHMIMATAWRCKLIWWFDWGLTLTVHMFMSTVWRRNHAVNPSWIRVSWTACSGSWRIYALCPYPCFTCKMWRNNWKLTISFHKRPHSLHIRTVYHTLVVKMRGTIYPRTQLYTIPWSTWPDSSIVHLNARSHPSVLDTRHIRPWYRCTSHCASHIVWANPN